MADAVRVEHRQVEVVGVLSDEYRSCEEPLEVGGDGLDGRGRRQVGFADAGEVLDDVGDRAVGVYEGLERVDHAVEGEADGADLHDGVGVYVEAGGLEVEGDVFPVH